ncbi:PREDICTED: U-box domain-containing protein 33 isoform X1 [Brassica oleracea var. oleracea]|uniref:U-box domain-containing protein 33 isoform X1 n=1 Tax=Brassica oleracea var. oleracea TaxID=109376 RepID=UPI0006A712AE|nr:PREDICTED: U-box domain-containing protein 33 isoform X1 [Brassica oleracea var. oleracea]
MEKEEAAAAVMEEVIYVAVGRETAKNKSNLTWAIDNSQGNKICIVLVHQPPHMIPVCKFSFSSQYKSKRVNGFDLYFFTYSTVGTRFDAATVDEELVIAYREKQKAKTDKILDEYLRICLKKGVHAEKLCVEMDSIEKGIVKMIHENKVRKLIMGATADKHYSTKMEELRSRKAIFVCQHASPTCCIRFICKGHLIHTRKGRMDEVRALSALLSDFQRLVSSRSSSNSDMLSGSSKVKSGVEEEEGTSRTSSSRSVGTLSYSGGSEASPSVTEDKSNHSSPPPSLPCTGMGLGMISILIHSTKLWHKRAIQNHKLCE